MSKNTPPHKAEEFLQQAYASDDESSQLAFYKKWAQEYDTQMLEGLDYESPQKIARCLSRHLKHKHEPVLDIGCGTGLTAMALISLGYGLIDGVDYSAEMIAVARAKSIYQNLHVADLNQTLDFDNDHYAAIISSGTFTHGHVGPQPLDELVRVLKPGGYLACTIHQDLWQQAGFEDKINRLKAAGRLEEVERIKDRFFKGKEREGWFCVYQKP